MTLPAGNRSRSLSLRTEETRVPSVPPPLARYLTRRVTGTRYGNDGQFEGSSCAWEVTAPPPAMFPAIQDFAHQVELALSPAPRDRLLARIFALLSHYPARSHADQVEYAIAEDWADDLAEFPYWAIAEAARQWRWTQTFRPAISELRRFCKEAVHEHTALLEGARALLELADPSEQARRGAEWAAYAESRDRGSGTSNRRVG